MSELQVTGVSPTVCLVRLRCCAASAAQRQLLTTPEVLPLLTPKQREAPLGLDSVYFRSLSRSRYR